MEDSRVMRLFLESIKSESTRKAYNYHVSKFVQYYKLKSPESIVKIEQRKLQEMIEDYVMYFKSSGKSLSYHKITVSALEHLIIMSSDLILNWKRIRQLFPEKTKPTTGFAWSTEDIKEMLKATSSKRNKAIILLLSSSGVREGALYELKLKHLAEMPLGCKSVIIYPNTDSEYIAFLTTESSKALDDYLNERRSDGEYISLESPLFRQAYQVGSSKAKHLKDGSLINMLAGILRKAGLRKGQTTKGRYEQQMFHSFRRRFNTILKLNREINPHVAERLLGHNAGANQEFALDKNYFKPTKDVLFDEFKKAIADLSIENTERIEAENKKLQQEKSELYKKTEKIEELSTELDKVKAYIERQKDLKNPKDEEIKKLKEELERLQK